MAIYPALSIGQKGAFSFASPYDKEEYKNIELEVIGIRSLPDLVSSNLNPYDSVYEPMQLSKDDFLEDLNTNVPIITFKTSNGEFLYVPADRVKSYPDITGVKYQQMILAISLDAVPLDMDLERVKEAVVETVYSTIGIQSTVEKVKSSATVLISKDEDSAYRKLLQSRRTETKSYRIRYEELLENYNKLKKQHDGLIECLKKHYVPPDRDN